MSKLKTILIDPKKRTVENLEIDYDHQDLNSFTKMKEAIDLKNRDLAQLVYANSITGDSLLVDEEGLIKDGDKDLFLFFVHEDNYYQILCGKTLVVGTDNVGDFCDVDFFLDDVKDRILWDNNNLHRHPRISGIINMTRG